MINEPKTDPIPAPDPATPTVAAPAPMNLAAESMSLFVWVVESGRTCGGVIIMNLLVLVDAADAARPTNRSDLVLLVVLVAKELKRRRVFIFLSSLINYNSVDDFPSCFFFEEKKKFF